MLRMEPFDYRHARTWEEALSLHGEGAIYSAGGTDLLPNLKHRLFHPKVVVGIGGIPGGITETETEVVVGATTRLSAIAGSPVIRNAAPGLAEAAGVVASPQIRAMGTIGGNVLLDTRCLFYNQTEFWRDALGYCLKAEGTWCHVVNGPKTCVAAQSSDTVPVLLAMGATLALLGPAGERRLPIRDLYRFNGMDHLHIQKGELLTAIHLPKPAASGGGASRTRARYLKLRTRESIDFPQIGVAIVGRFEGEDLADLQVVIGAANPQPKPVRGLAAFYGRPLGATEIGAIGDLVYQQTRPQGSVHGSVAWRRQMAAVMTRRGLGTLASAPGVAPG